MNLFHAILLGIVQGLTEFLPVSSTAHLTLAENLLFGRSMPLAFDVLLHVGTLLALVVYFRQDLVRILLGLGGQGSGGSSAGALAAGGHGAHGGLRAGHPPLQGSGQGPHLGLRRLPAAHRGHALRGQPGRQAQGRARASKGSGPWDALAVGSIQGLGGGFGLSRSGSTLSMGVFRGLSLPASPPVQLPPGHSHHRRCGGPGRLEAREAPAPRTKPLPPEMMFPPGSMNPALACLAGVVASAVSGYAAIGLLERFTRQPRLTGFAVYCVGIGAVLLVLGTRLSDAGEEGP